MRNAFDPSEQAEPKGKAAGATRHWVAFGLVCLVLAVGAVGLEAATRQMKLFFLKLPVEAEPITLIPDKLGPWVQVSVDKPLPPDVEHVLGTKEYINRIYVDTRRLDPEVVRAYELRTVKTDADRRRLMDAAASAGAEAVVTLHVAYYTGGVDTVPHIPERCYVAGGNTASSVAFEQWPVANNGHNTGGEMLPVRFMQFQSSQSGYTPITQNVGYFFQVNGDYESDALGGVRKRLQSLTESHAYFCKIEVMTQRGDSEAEPAREVLTDFLAHAMPEIEQILPDWDEVQKQAQGQDKK